MTKAAVTLCLLFGLASVAGAQAVLQLEAELPQRTPITSGSMVNSDLLPLLTGGPSHPFGSMRKLTLQEFLAWVNSGASHPVAEDLTTACTIGQAVLSDGAGNMDCGNVSSVAEDSTTACLSGEGIFSDGAGNMDCGRQSSTVCIDADVDGVCEIGVSTTKVIFDPDDDGVVDGTFSKSTAGAMQSEMPFSVRSSTTSNGSYFQAGSSGTSLFSIRSSVPQVVFDNVTRAGWDDAYFNRVGVGTVDYLASGSQSVTLTPQGITADAYRIGAVQTAPATATDTCTAGELRIAADAIYLCSATDTWVRATLATF